jgi:hypothetical protein
MTGDPPNNLEVVDPSARFFPAGWRDAAIRRLYNPEQGGVTRLPRNYAP